MKDWLSTQITSEKQENENLIKDLQENKSKATKSVNTIIDWQGKFYFMSLKRFIFEAWGERT